MCGLATALALAGLGCQHASPSSAALREQAIANQRLLRQTSGATLDATRELVVGLEARDDRLREALVAHCEALEAAESARLTAAVDSAAREALLTFDGAVLTLVSDEYPRQFDATYQPLVRRIQGLEAQLAALRRRIDGAERNDTTLLRDHRRSLEQIFLLNAKLLQDRGDGLEQIARESRQAREQLASELESRLRPIREQAEGLASGSCAIGEDPGYAVVLAAIDESQVRVADLYAAQLEALLAQQADAEKPGALHLVASGALSGAADELGRLPVVGAALGAIVTSHSEAISSRLDALTESLGERALRKVDELRTKLEKSLAGGVVQALAVPSPENE